MQNLEVEGLLDNGTSNYGAVLITTDRGRARLIWHFPGSISEMDGREALHCVSNALEVVVGAERDARQLSVVELDGRGESRVGFGAYGVGSYPRWPQSRLVWSEHSSCRPRR